jgi:hypothetical protein
MGISNLIFGCGEWGRTQVEWENMGNMIINQWIIKG